MTDIAKKTTSWIQQNQDRIMAQAPPDTDPNELKRLAISVEQKARKGQFDSVDPASLVNALLESFHLGLDIPLGEAHLVPRGSEVKLHIDYKGLVKLAEQSPDIRKVKGEIVRENDNFQYRIDSDGVQFEHQPEPFGGGEPVGVYAVAWQTGGGIADLVTLSLDEIETIRGQAETDYVWSQWWGEMAKKSAIRRLLKMFDKTEQASDGVQHDRQVEYGNVETKKRQSSGVDKLNAELVDDSDGGETDEPTINSADEAQELILNKIEQVAPDKIQPFADFLAYSHTGDCAFNQLRDEDKISLARELQSKASSRSIPPRIISGVDYFLQDHDMGECNASPSVSNARAEVSKHYDVLSKS